MESDVATAPAQEVSVPSGHVQLPAVLEVPDAAIGFVLFAHGAGSSRLSPRNHKVATVLRRAGFGTLLFDLLTGEEEAEDQATGSLRFDVPLLARRLVDATLWVERQEGSRGLPIGTSRGPRSSASPRPRCSSRASATSRCWISTASPSRACTARASSR